MLRDSAHRVHRYYSPLSLGTVQQNDSFQRTKHDVQKLIDSQVKLPVFSSPPPIARLDSASQSGFSTFQPKPTNLKQKSERTFQRIQPVLLNSPGSWSNSRTGQPLQRESRLERFTEKNRSIHSSPDRERDSGACVREPFPKARRPVTCHEASLHSFIYSRGNQNFSPPHLSSSPPGRLHAPGPAAGTVQPRAARAWSVRPLHSSSAVASSAFSLLAGVQLRRAPRPLLPALLSAGFTCLERRAESSRNVHNALKEGEWCAVGLGARFYSGPGRKVKGAGLGEGERTRPGRQNHAHCSPRMQRHGRLPDREDVWRDNVKQGRIN
ncbi:hypothetical protein MHYP_G00266960 [Metynnis hypsauchen]